MSDGDDGRTTRRFFRSSVPVPGRPPGRLPGRRHASLRGVRTLLTGASSGIGRALALALAAQGAHLVLAARRAALLHELADEIADSGHAAPHLLPCDLAERGAPRRLADDAMHALGGGVDVLINNAGAGPIAPQIGLGDGDEARTAFETNLWAPLALTAAVVPGMRRAGRGTIVNVTSTLQAVPLPLTGYYGASKAALSQATRVLRRELAGTPVRVLEAAPGGTDTALRDVGRLPWRGRAPDPPVVSPESVAAATVRALRRGNRRLVHPAYGLLPLELPALGRALAALTGRRLDLTRALGPAHGEGEQ